MTNNEVTAACAAVSKLADEIVPMLERPFVTVDLIQKFVVAALTAAESTRADAVDARRSNP